TRRPGAVLLARRPRVPLDPRLDRQRIGWRRGRAVRGPPPPGAALRDRRAPIARHAAVPQRRMPRHGVPLRRLRLPGAARRRHPRLPVRRAIPPARRGDAMAAGAAALRRPRPACKLQNRGLRELVVVAIPVYALDPFGPLVDAKTRSPRADGIGEAYLPLGLGLVLERARIMT